MHSGPCVIHHFDLDALPVAMENLVRNNPRWQADKVRLQHARIRPRNRPGAGKPPKLCRKLCLETQCQSTRPTLGCRGPPGGSSSSTLAGATTPSTARTLTGPAAAGTAEAVERGTAATDPWGGARETTRTGTPVSASAERAPGSMLSRAAGAPRTSWTGGRPKTAAGGRSLNAGSPP